MSQTALRFRLARWACAVLAPPLAVLALHEVLTLRAAALQPAFVVRFLSGGLTNDVFGLWDLLLPVLVLLAIIALALWLALWLRRRVGWARALLTLWWLLGAVAVWFVWLDQGDLAWLKSAPAWQARVFDVTDYPPKADDPGGAAVVLSLRGLSVVSLEGALPGSIERCDWLDLRMARGARGGSYVTAWSVVASAPRAAASDAVVVDGDHCPASSAPAAAQ